MGRILVIDDEPEIVAFFSQFLTSRGHVTLGASDSREAESLLRSFRPDLCILDVRMPYFSGADILDGIKKTDSAVEVVFLTAQTEVVQAIDLMRRGAIDYLLKPVELSQLEFAVVRALDHRRLILENTAYRLHLEQLVDEKTAALNSALQTLGDVHSSTLDALAMALDFRDQGTSGHSRRVARLTRTIAAELGIQGDRLVQIEHGSLLHDLGKLKIPDQILWKPGPLTEDEWKTIRRHPAYGFEFLSKLVFLADAAEIVYCHHEKYDGSGYPRRLSQEEIPLGARIFAIVDAVDAQIYDRPYHAAVTFSEAAAEIRRCAGTHFDPDLVGPALAYLEKELGS